MNLIASTGAAKAPTPVYFDFTPYGITPKRPVEIRRDPSGELVVLVRLTGGNIAVTTLAEFTSLMRAGISPNWFSNGNGQGNAYVCSSQPNGTIHSPVMIARLLTVPRRLGLVVSYKDRNPFNLRPDNLMLEERRTRAKLKERAILGVSSA